MITKDYNRTAIGPEESRDIKAIADVEISEITSEDYPNLLIFPDSFQSYDRDFGNKVVCNIINDGKEILTNSIVGFIGRNNTRLSIHSRFVNSKKDYFLHYMLQKVAKINLLSLHHTIDEDSVFDFLIYLFPTYLKRAINQGIYKQYDAKKHNDANVKGPVDPGRHLRYNIPFNGKIAYTAREYSYDNNITELIRHTIHVANKHYLGREVLNIDSETQQAVSRIIDATPGFDHKKVISVMNKNLRPVIHPYYSNYIPLQKLCMQILRHEELKYGHEENEIYGVLIDAAWLWEEYLSMLLEGHFVHCLKNQGKRYYLFDGFQQIIPDYLSLDKSVVADAKYIPLNKERWYGEEKATSIYYKTITYMYRFCCNTGFLLYPHPDEDVSPQYLKIDTEKDGINGGTIIKLGLRIPSDCVDFNEFATLMNKYEEIFINRLNVS